jgi:hypothetical protein
MSNVTDPFELEPRKRPVFLLVLCILTFVYSGFSVCSNIYSYVTAGAAAIDMQKSKKQINEGMKQDGAPKEIANFVGDMADLMTEKNIKNLALGSFTAALLCLIGALLMFQLNKKGFAFYVAGTVVGIVVPILVMSSNLFAIIGTVVAGIVGAAFCVMYGVNLKAMK